MRHARRALHARDNEHAARAGRESREARMRHGRQIRRACDGGRGPHGARKAMMEIAKGARRRSSPFARIEDAVEAIRAGRMIIVVDDEDRENEGDLTIAAEEVTPETINFMARYGRGLICLSMTPERLDELELRLTGSQNSSRLETEFCVSLVKRVASAKLPTDFGKFHVHAFENLLDKQTHIALVCGDIADGQDVLVRVHSQCLTGDVFHSARCDCGAQLEIAMQRIGAEGRGILLYLNQEGRGIGLANKIRAYELQDEGFDTVEANERLGFKADQRDYGMGVQILREIGVRSMRLLSNNPRKLVAIEGYGLSVSE